MLQASTLGMDMGPGGGAPANEFRANDQGHAMATLRVPSENTYGMMVVAYHADDQTHGDMPGEMGAQTFEQFMGPWPGPEGEMSDCETRLLPLGSGRNSHSSGWRPSDEEAVAYRKPCMMPILRFVLVGFAALTIAANSARADWSVDPLLLPAPVTAVRQAMECLKS